MLLKLKVYWYIKALVEMQHCLCRLPSTLPHWTCSPSAIRCMLWIRIVRVICVLWRLQSCGDYGPGSSFFLTCSWKISNISFDLEIPTRATSITDLRCVIISLSRSLGAIQLRKWLIWLPMGKNLFSEGETRLDSYAALLLGSNFPCNMYLTRHLDGSWSIPLLVF